MPSSRFYLAVINKHEKQTVYLKPGGVAERAIVDEIVDVAARKGIGFFKTETAVKDAIRQAVEEVLRSVKSDVYAPNT